MYYFMILLISSLLTYIFSCLVLNHPFELVYPTQSYSSTDESLTKILFDSFGNFLYTDSLDMVEDQINISFIIEYFLDLMSSSLPGSFTFLYFLYRFCLLSSDYISSYLFYSLHHYIYLDSFDFFSVVLKDSPSLFEYYGEIVECVDFSLDMVEIDYSSSERFIHNFISEVTVLDLK